MPLVPIDPDVYDFLRSNVRDFNETVSAVLRRLHNLPDPKIPSPPTPGGAPSATAASPLSQFIAEMRGKRYRTATGKFLDILAFVHSQDPQPFEKVLAVGGRRRKYFARSRQEIAGSGTSTHPRQIPRSDFWVMTNADTAQKRDMLSQALRVLGYSDDDIRTAADAVRGRG